MKGNAESASVSFCIFCPFKFSPSKEAKLSSGICKNAFFMIASAFDRKYASSPASKKAPLPPSDKNFLSSVNFMLFHRKNI